jgi:Zn-dependent protease/predicted transcriptional regulator
MKWSRQIGRIAGIRLYVHGTFLILLAWIVISNLMSGYGIAAALESLIFIFSLFAIVVLHELGHALTARRYGIQTRDITLLPIGGVARLERMPEEPIQELLVALAGPAVNVVLAAALFATLMIISGVQAATQLTLVGGSFLAKLMWINVSLAVFNLLPAFPMDGGRVLRALLALRLDYVRATQIAASVGQGMALLFGLAGLMFNPFLLFIAFFVWIGAAEEAALVQTRASLSDVPVAAAMIRNFETLSSRDIIERAVEHFLVGFQQDFPVLEDGRLIGVLTHNDLLAALAKREPDVLVTLCMHREFKSGRPTDMLADILSDMQQSDCPVVPVINEGKVEGLITSDNLREFLLIQNTWPDRVKRHKKSVPARRLRPIGI